MFTAMLHGAVSFVDTNKFIDTHFTPGEDILTYSLNHYDLRCVLNLIDQPDKFQAIAEIGQDKVRSSHMWLNRAGTILETCSNINFSCRKKSNILSEHPDL